MLSSCDSLPAWTARGSSPFSSSVSEVDAAPGSLSALLTEARGGVHRAPLRQSVHRDSFGPPCWDREGVTCAPLRRIDRLRCPGTGIVGGRCLLCALLQARVQIKSPRHSRVFVYVRSSSSSPTTPVPPWSGVLSLSATDLPSSVGRESFF